MVTTRTPWDKAQLHVRASGARRGACSKAANIGPLLGQRPGDHSSKMASDLVGAAGLEPTTSAV
jgi:hypothetical protein